MLPENTREAKRNTAGYPAGPSRPFFPCNLLVCVCVADIVLHTQVSKAEERERETGVKRQSKEMVETDSRKSNGPL
jgi:hypothetical protein